MTGRPDPVVAADDFARRFSMRAGSLMWLLGAGASAPAGIPTAWDMIWEGIVTFAKNSGFWSRPVPPWNSPSH